MSWLTAIFTQVGIQIADVVWTRFESYLERKYKVSGVTTQAKQLNEELKSATSKEEYHSILEKFGAFQDSIDDL